MQAYLPMRIRRRRSPRRPQVSSNQRCCLALLALAACGADPASKQPDLSNLTLVHEDSSGLPFAGLSAEWKARFNVGDALFDQVFLDSQGLGPVFIRPSCASCHASDGRGPGAVRKMVLLDDAGLPLPDQSALAYGHTVRPQTAAGASQGITPPDDTSHMLLTVRMPPAVFGRGALEAIADSEIERAAAEQAERDDGISGRVNWVTYASEPNPDTRFHAHVRGEKLIGRFGLKARVATLDDFTADAYQGDMGITSDLRPDELPNPAASDDELPGIDLPAETVNNVADYMRLLRIPSRAPDPEVNGATLFARAQCNVCHIPTLHTQADYPIPQLADVDAPIYSDLLLHDMGPAYADGLNDYEAGSSEWRTAPLVGLRHLRNYLHDGRAKTIEQAIQLHDSPGSEAAGSEHAFEQLDAASRAELIEFVSAL
jgi:CxxC motif-containing protein (DUF1111 family)